MLGVERRVAVHLAFDLQLGVRGVQHAQRGAHLLGGRRIGRAEGRVRQQRHPRLDAEALRISSAASSVISTTCSGVGS
jgi:hypothetical protein